MPVRGIDRLKNVQPEYPPTSDLAADAIACHAHVMGDQQQVLMRNTKAAAMR